MIHKISLFKVNSVLLSLVLIGLILYLAKQVLIPVTFAVFFAMLFTPISNRMEKVGIKRVFTATISLLIIMVVSAVIVGLVLIQAKQLANELPEMEKRSLQFLERSQNFISRKLHVPIEKQDELIKNEAKELMKSSSSVVNGFVTGSVGWLASAVLVIVFTFLFLFQREKYERFFVRLFHDTPKKESELLIGKVAKVAQSYLTGRALSIIIFAVLFTIGFLIIGLKNAFLLAFIAALLTIIPYVGSIIGGLFPFAVALVTEDSSSIAFAALGVIVVIQAIDNYFIEPYIIGGEVNISAFFTILIFIIGGLLWGVAGMILFLPMLGVAKIVFDAVPGLQVYGYLIGDQQEGKQSTRLFKKIIAFFKRKKS